MTALDVLAIPESSDNFDDQNFNGHAPEFREVRDCSCNFPDVRWSTLEYNDSLVAQAPPRAALESHRVNPSLNDLPALTFAHAELTADTLPGFSALGLYSTLDAHGLDLWTRKRLAGCELGRPHRHCD